MEYRYIEGSQSQFYYSFIITLTCVTDFDDFAKSTFFFYCPETTIIKIRLDLNRMIVKGVYPKLLKVEGNAW